MATSKKNVKILGVEEEKALRMLHGIKADPRELLPRKTDNEEILARLLRLEEEIIKRAHERPKKD